MVEPPFIKDVPYNPEYTAAGIVAAKKFLEAPSGYSDNANFAFIVGDELAGVQLNKPCHAGIGYPSVTDPCLVASWTKSGGKDHRRWYEWVMTESPYRHFFLPESDVDFAEHGIIVSTDMPGPILQNLMILQRHGWEMSDLCHQLFEEYIRNGIPGWLGYPYVVNTAQSWEGAGIYCKPVLVDTFRALLNTPLQPCCSNHRAHIIFRTESHKNFRAERLGSFGFQNAYDRLTDPVKSYRRDHRYIGGLNLWDNNSYPSPGDNLVTDLLKDEEFREAFSSRRRKLVTNTIPDPFRNYSGSVVNTQGVTYGDLLEFILPYALEKVFHDKPLDNLSSPYGTRADALPAAIQA